MTVLRWEEAPVAKHHDRAGLDCGDTGLNTYIQRYDRQQGRGLGGALLLRAVERCIRVASEAD